jgi:hypothetical protein
MTPQQPVPTVSTPPVSIPALGFKKFLRLVRSELKDRAIIEYTESGGVWLAAVDKGQTTLNGKPVLITELIQGDDIDLKAAYISGSATIHSLAAHRIIDN